MKHIYVTDFTLRNFCGSFKDGAEIAKLLDKSGVSTIVTMPIKEQEKDSLFLRTLSQVVENATLCVPVEADKLTEENTKLKKDVEDLESYKLQNENSILNSKYNKLSLENKKYIEDLNNLETELNSMKSKLIPVLWFLDICLHSLPGKP